MNIPKAVKIGGKIYTVEITNKLDLGNYFDLVTRICPQAQQKMEADFLHELMHGVMVHLGYSEHEEKKIEELASALYMVIQDNPELFAEKS